MPDPRYSDAGYGSVTGHGNNTYTPFVDKRNNPVAVAGAYNNDSTQTKGNSHYSPVQLSTIKIITEEANKAGKDPAIFIAMAKKESDLGANVGSPNASFRGVMQMGAGAAKDAGLPWAQVDDPRSNIAAAIKYADINSKRTGIPVTLENAGAIYVAHQQGAGGAKAIYKGDPNASIYTALKKENADGNGMAGMTIGQARAKWDGGTQAFANQWAGVAGQAEQANVANALGMGGANLPNPQSQLSAVQGYNTNMVNAAQHVADNNLAAVNNFGWNPTVKDSAAQHFGKAVQSNTEAMTALNNRNAESMKAFSAPTAETGLGRTWDRLKAMWNITGTGLQSDYYNALQAEQSGTGKAMTDQVNNMKSAMADTSINPEVYNKAASNLTSQQQVENQSYNAVAGNYNQQNSNRIQEKNVDGTIDANRQRQALDEQRFQLDRTKFDFELENAKRANDTARVAALQMAQLNVQGKAAWTSMGFSPETYTSYDTAMNLIVDPAQKKLFADKTINSTNNANNLYDMIVAGRGAGASDAMRNTANKYGSILDAVMAAPSTIAALEGVKDEKTGVVTGGIKDPAARDKFIRDLVAKTTNQYATGEATGNAAIGDANPYSLYNRQEAIYNGVTLPAGVSRDTLANKASAITFAYKAGVDAGKDLDTIATELANAYGQVTKNIDSNNKGSGIALAPMQTRFKLSMQSGKTVNLDLTNPQDVKLALARVKLEANTGFIDKVLMTNGVASLGSTNPDPVKPWRMVTDTLFKNTRWDTTNAADKP